MLLAWKKGKQIPNQCFHKSSSEILKVSWCLCAEVKEVWHFRGWNRVDRERGGAKEEGEASAQAAGGPPGDLGKLENLQEDLWGIFWGEDLQPRKRRETSGLIIDVAAAAMDEGMETCSGDILGDEEEVKVSPRSCISELTYSARFINCGFNSNSCQRGI